MTNLTLILIAIALLFLVMDNIIRRQRERKEHQRKQQQSTSHVYLNTPTKSTTLSPIIDSALDEYDRAGIRIPLDIIEDIADTEFKTVDDCIKIIDMHRNNWKIENNKKLIRR